MRAILGRTMLGCMMAAGIIASAGAAPASSAAPSAAIEQRVQQIKDAMSSKPEAALALARSLQAALAGMPRNPGSAHAMAEAMWLEGEARLRRGDTDQALHVIDAALAIVAQANDHSKLRGDLLLSRGWLATQRTDVAGALSDYQTAYKIFAALHEARSMGLALKQIATLYRLANDYVTSAKYENQSVEVYSGDPRFEIVTYNNRGNELDAMKKYDEAEKSLRIALRIANKIKSYDYQIGIIRNIARVQIESGKLNQAERTLSTLRNMAAVRNSSDQRLKIDALAAQLSAARGDYGSATRMIAGYFSGVDLTKTDLPDRAAHETAYKAYAHLFKFEPALHHLEALKRLDDRTASLTASANTALMAARFDAANKDAKIANLKADEARRKFEYERQRGRMMQAIFVGVMAAGLVGVAMLVTALLTIRRSRNEVRAANADLAQTNTALEKALAAKTEFLATTSHEIRTPLNGILGMAQVMLADRGLPAATRDRLNVVHGAGVTMKALVDDILDVAKMETGNLTLERIPVDLPATLSDVSRLWEEQARAKGVAFLVDTANCPKLIEGDPARLRQIAFNLLSNALKFTAKGSIRLEASLVGTDRVRIAVHDTGIGIPADKLELIFESFRQVDAGTTRRFGGTGLGLSICRNLARAMGGEVMVSSTLGEGSTFALELPYHAADEGRGADVGDNTEHRIVMIVERNPIARGMMKALLADHAEGISFVPSLEEARALIGGVTPEIVLIDEATARTSEAMEHELPALIAAARAAGARPVLLWSVVSAKDTGLIAGVAAADIIAKPVAGPELVRRLWAAPVALSCAVEQRAA